MSHPKALTPAQLLADEILQSLKHRIFDLQDFQIIRVESDPGSSVMSSKQSMMIRLPNGDEITVSLYTKRSQP